MQNQGRLFRFTAIAAITLCLPPIALAAPTGVVSDDFFPGVRSDGGGIYEDGIECVRIAGGKRGGGFYQLRTVDNTDECKDQPFQRFLTLDFGGDPGGDLDGVANDSDATVEGPPARLLAFTAFGKKAARDGTEVLILVMEVNPGGTTTQETAWELRYQNLAEVTVLSKSSRRIFLNPGRAAADLFEIVISVNKQGRVKKKAILRGTFDMPFNVTADIGN